MTLSVKELLARGNIAMGTVFRETRINPDSYNEEKNTVDLVFSTGARVLRYNWDIGYYYEELSMEPSAIRMDRLNSGACPVLDSHQAYALENILGRCLPGTGVIADGEGRTTAQFSTRESIAPLVADIKSGIINNVSVGYRTHKLELVETGTDGSYPIYRATDWEPYEVSMVPIPADAAAGTRSDGNATTNHNCQIVSARALETKGDKTMTEEEKARQAEAQKASEATATANAAEATRAAVQAETSRVLEITNLARLHKMPETFASEHIEKKTGLDDVRAAILATKVAQESQQNEIRSHVPAQVVGDKVTQRCEAMASAILHRIDPIKHKLEGQATEFRGLTMFDMARDYVEQVMGKNTRGWARDNIVKHAFAHKNDAARSGAMHTTSDFANILGNVVNTVLGASYEQEINNYEDIVRRRTATDYRPINTVNLGEGPELLPVNEAGEYEYGTLGESKETIKVGKFGRIIKISEEAIINDSLGAFTDLAELFGQKAAQLIRNLVWDAIRLNPNMGDGNPLFHASHGNLITGTGNALTGDAAGLAALQKMRLMLRTQKRPNSNENVNNTLGTLVLPPELETAGETLIYPVSPTAVGQVNTFARTLTPVVEGRLSLSSTSEYYGIAKGVRPVDLLFLEGYQDGPKTETRNGWEMDCVEIKCKTAAAAAPNTYVGIVKSNGAA